MLLPKAQGIDCCLGGSHVHGIDQSAYYSFVFNELVVTCRLMTRSAKRRPKMGLERLYVQLTREEKLRAKKAAKKLNVSVSAFAAGEIVKGTNRILAPRKK